jgi:prepilin-type N-terminal cleavage/methylation domain-containing protein
MPSSYASARETQAVMHVFCYTYSNPPPMKLDRSPRTDSVAIRPTGFTLIELLVVIAIIAILAVVVVLTLNPVQLLAESRDANRVSDMATLQSGGPT